MSRTAALRQIAPSLVFHGGRVITLEPGQPRADAIAILGIRILAVGATAGVLGLRGPDTRVIDLRGRTVVPGLIDNHTHYLLAGPDAPEVGVRVNITQARSIAELVGQIKQRAESAQPGEWVITSCMYRGPLAEGRSPDRHDLDPVSPGNPAYIFQSGKNIIVNSAALRLAGIDRGTPDPVEPEGHIVKDSGGSPTGHLIAGAADLARSRW